MIDLSPMRCGAASTRARTRAVQGGATWRDVDRETTAFGLATPGGLISTTGVAGLTLSGGIGWLRGSHGLCIDNLLSADVVTADGRLLHASGTDNSDLFWALRGGGGNFGIVTAFEFRLHPIEPELMAVCAPSPNAGGRESSRPGATSWRPRRTALGSLVEFSTLPDDPSLPQEARGARVITVGAVYDGPAEEGEALVAAIAATRDAAGRFQRQDAVLRRSRASRTSFFPKGRDRSYFKSLYLSRLDGDGDRRHRRPAAGAAVGDDIHVGLEFRRRGRPRRSRCDRVRRPQHALHAQHRRDVVEAGGRRGEHRLVARLLVRHAAPFGRSAVSQLPRPRRGRGPGAGCRSAPDTYARLVEVKRKYDPTNFFRINQNITPA